VVIEPVVLRQRYKLFSLQDYDAEFLLSQRRKEVLNDMNANIKYFDFLIFVLLAPLRENNIAATG
jgi:hypothetical protein